MRAFPTLWAHGSLDVGFQDGLCGDPCGQVSHPRGAGGSPRASVSSFSASVAIAGQCCWREGPKVALQRASQDPERLWGGDGSETGVAASMGQEQEEDGAHPVARPRDPGQSVAVGGGERWEGVEGDEQCRGGAWRGLGSELPWAQLAPGLLRTRWSFLVISEHAPAARWLPASPPSLPPGPRPRPRPLLPGPGPREAASPSSSCCGFCLEASLSHSGCSSTSVSSEVQILTGGRGGRAKRKWLTLQVLGPCNTPRSGHPVG